jgi:hypothetical protein
MAASDKLLSLTSPPTASASEGGLTITAVYTGINFIYPGTKINSDGKAKEKYRKSDFAS